MFIACLLAGDWRLPCHSCDMCATGGCTHACTVQWQLWQNVAGSLGLWEGNVQMCRCTYISAFSAFSFSRCAMKYAGDALRTFNLCGVVLGAGCMVQMVCWRLGR
jgi:hypothetical protein